MRPDLVDEVLKRIDPAKMDPQDLPERIEGYVSQPLDAASFDTLSAVAHDHKACYVDGGQGDLILTPGFSFHFFRIKGIIRGKDTTESQLTSSFYALCSHKDGKVFSTIFPDEGESLMETEIEHEDDLSLEEAPGLVRRMAELSLARKAIGKLDKGDLICMDGDLQANHRMGKDFLSQLSERTKDHGINLLGLSKTCSLKTKGGFSLLSALDAKAPSGSWLAKGIYLTEDGRIRIGFARLHPAASHIFRIDGQADEQGFINVTAMLARDASDATFPGYPYGLILADRLARISSQERTYLLTRLKTLAGDRFQAIASSLNSLNAHDVLDALG